MKLRLVHVALLAAATMLAGCNASLEDIAPKAERQLPAKVVQTMKAKGMTTTSPIMVRLFKEEAVLEVWKQKDNGRYDLVQTYEICKWSGKLGPKFTEGDRQAPEGFYTVASHQMNPNSSYHLSFNIGFPNVYDRAHGRSGQHLMVHGGCSSSGCYSMTDESVEQIYAFARDAFKGGQQAFQLQAFPFRMTAQNMARYKSDPNYEFWTMLKEGYDHFEITKVPPKVDVCERRYVFNQFTADGRAFSPTGACPAATQPEALQTAYKTYQTTFDAAFTSALSGSTSKPAASITGVKEAALVADWSRKRARGERVSQEPPNFEQSGVMVSTRPPSERPPVTTASVTRPAQAAPQQPATAQAATVAAAVQPLPVEQQAAAPAVQQAEQPSRLGRLMSLFGND
ncbi:MAG: murein L,D-transpeptidase family protein [Aliihoeflea sp.]